MDFSVEAVEARSILPPTLLSLAECHRAGEFDGGVVVGVEGEGNRKERRISEGAKNIYRADTSEGESLNKRGGSE
jgi:hypothetical protein